MGRWIVRTRLLRVRGELRNAVGNRSDRWLSREGLLVALDDGVTVGLGEATPLPGFSRDTVEQCELALREVHRELGPAPESHSLEAIVRAMVTPVIDRLKGVPAARFALETALWSWAKNRSRDEASSAERRLEASNRDVLESTLLGGGAVDPERWAELAGARLERGTIAAVKVKVGRSDLSIEREIAGVRALRATLARECELRLDANGAWSVEQARSLIERFAAAGADSVEEPCSGEALLSLRSCAIPWLVDESLAREGEGFAERVVSEPGCGGLVLKPALLGGVIVCLDLLRLAASRSKRCALSHVFDGPIALKMTAEIAGCSPLPPLPSALGWHEGLDAWPRRVRRSKPDRYGEGPPWAHYALSANEWGLGLGSPRD
jgi:o-succinylbenzoate synthase